MTQYARYTKPIANSKQIAKYKQTIMAQILSNSELTSFIDSTVPASELPYRNIFPFSKIVGSIDEAKLYILIEVNMPSLLINNRSYKEIIFTLTVVCHDDLMKADNLGMTRLDYVGTAIEELFSGSIDFGLGETEVISNIEGVWTERHNYREIRFRTVDRVRRGC